MTNFAGDFLVLAANTWSLDHFRCARRERFRRECQAELDVRGHLAAGAARAVFGSTGGAIGRRNHHRMAGDDLAKPVVKHDRRCVVIFGEAPHVLGGHEQTHF